MGLTVPLSTKDTSRCDYMKDLKRRSFWINQVDPKRKTEEGRRVGRSHVETGRGGR